VSFATITLCVASHLLFIFAYFVMTQSGNFWVHPRRLRALDDRMLMGIFVTKREEVEGERRRLHNE
jgi:hypothetical protein